MIAKTGQKNMRNLEGVVISDRMQKTLVVAVTRLKKHPKYQKYFKFTATFKVHDETNQAKVGDRVVMEETRPLSKDKRWRLVAIVEKARKPLTEASEAAAAEAAGGGEAE